ncbi:MAG: hypothetical protein BHW55_01665 [Candidatus Melainabacteria bacterium 35_41]|nr:MAG: hypothetical protein BHW55_01665 [Candidatus Melainabacteria bacterium 35_41]
MRNKLIKISRIFFVVILAFLSMLIIFHRPKTETNILKAIFSNNEKVIVDLSTKFSAKINVIVESDSAETAETTAKNYYGQIDQTKMKTSDADIKGIIENYERHHYGLLSTKSERLLREKNYEQIEHNALELLYNPIMQPIGSIDDDPFLLLTDYVMSLSTTHDISNFTPIQLNDKYYSLIMLNVDGDTALSPSIMNEEVKRLVILQKELSTKDVKIYLTGTPVHSYYASTKSAGEINLICILSSLFIIGLIYFYFRSLKPLLPIAVTIGAGIWAGFLVTSLIFPTVHILTFVFSTTLIGICVDYTLHFFVSHEKDTSCDEVIKEIFKSLSVSLLTTASAFIVMLFSNFILLKQIAVFTVTGLATVYLFVILFYPLFCTNIYNPAHIKHFSIPEKFNKPILIAAGIIIAVGLFRIHFDDNIKNMYVPPKHLLNAEKLQSELIKSNEMMSIFVIEGKNLQELLEKEESITYELSKDNIEFQSLSKYLPSLKRQKSVQNLKKELYLKRLNDYAVFLPSDKRREVIDEALTPYPLNYNIKFEALKNNFLINENTSIVAAFGYEGGEINGSRVINFQKDISSQIKKCRIICLSLLLPIFAILYLLLAKIYDFKSAGKIVLPSILAGGVSLGLLGIFNQPVNLFHIIAVFLIIGFGLDYSVFRFGGAKKSADAVLISCLTSVFSFTLLALTGFKLISSLGIILAIGLLFSYIFSLVCIKDR